MAVIEVNHKVLREVAQDIEEYCATQDAQMSKADQAIKDMFIADWTGEDAREFRNKWQAVDAKGSITITFRDSLLAFSKSLKACATEYQNAQADSYTEASRLPKW